MVRLGAGLAAVMVLLGLWQLRVYERQGADVAAQPGRGAAGPAGRGGPAGCAVRDGYGRSVTFAGRYEPEHQVAGRRSAT